MTELVVPAYLDDGPARRLGPATGSPPPHNLDAERSVLGAALLAPKCLRPLIVEEGLRPEHFYRDRHRAIFAAMAAMSDAEQGIDALTVTAALRDAGTLADIGGPAAVDELTGGVPGLGNVRSYARIVIAEWRWRQRLTAIYEQHLAVASRDDFGFEAALGQASALVALTAEESFVEPADLASHMFDWMKAAPDEGLPLPRELSTLARILRLRAGHVTVIGGWSHHGKTLLALMLAATIGEHGHRAVIWTNEDTQEELVARYVNRVTGVPAAAIGDRRLTADQMRRVVAKLGTLPFGVQPAAGWDAMQIARHIRQVRPAVAVVDHFHNLPNVGKTEGVDDAMQTLVAAAGQTPCHLFLVSQLNQSRNMQVVRPAPVGRDLRGSGQLYALAHNVLLVHRDEEELEDDTGRKLGRAIQAETGHIDVVKNKPTGRLAAVPVTFDERRLVFVEPAARALRSAQPEGAAR